MGEVNRVCQEASDFDVGILSGLEPPEQLQDHLFAVND